MRLRTCIGLILLATSLPVMASNNLIMAAVHTYYPSYESHALSWIGSDAALQWTQYNNDNLPKANTFSAPNKISCAGDNCVATGNYNDGGYRGYLLTSANSGVRWAFKKIISDALLPYTIMSDVSCNQDGCVAIGGDYEIIEDQGIEYNLLIKNTNDFKTWDNITVNGLTQKVINMHLNCQKDFCVIAATIDTNRSKPLFIYSNKDRKRWSVARIEGETLNDYSIENVDCAVGWNMSEDEPAIFNSRDQGKTWNEQHVAVKYGQLSKIKCTTKSCIAAGKYGYIEENPLVLVSFDKGESWQQKEIKFEGKYGLYDTAVDCTDKYCLLLTTEHFSNTYLRGFSFDFGNTWQYEVVVTVIKTENPRIACDKENCFYTLATYLSKNTASKIFNVDKSGTRIDSVTTPVNEAVVSIGALLKY